MYFDSIKHGIFFFDSQEHIFMWSVKNDIFHYCCQKLYFYINIFMTVIYESENKVTSLLK